MPCVALEAKSRQEAETAADRAERPGMPGAIQALSLFKDLVLLSWEIFTNVSLCFLSLNNQGLENAPERDDETPAKVGESLKLSTL